MMNCFCGMVDRRKAFSVISSRDHFQRFSPSRISDMPRAGLEPAQNLSSGFVEWSFTVVITTTPLHYSISKRSRCKEYLFSVATYDVSRWVYPQLPTESLTTELELETKLATVTRLLSLYNLTKLWYLQLKC